MRVIRGFWKLLLAEKPDLNVLPAFISKMQKLERECDSLFVRLITQSSRSQIVLREYAAYLRNVKMNEENASKFEARAEQLEHGDTYKAGDSTTFSGSSDMHLDESQLSTQGKYVIKCDQVRS